MKQTISTASQFRDAFRAMDRHGNFSYEGMKLLFDYLEECDPDYELDVVAICCEYSESMPIDIAENYSIDIDGLDDGEILDSIIQYLENHSIIVGTTDAGAIVYQQF